MTLYRTLNLITKGGQFVHKECDIQDLILFYIIIDYDFHEHNKK